ncbi:unnamed protein product [Paramecium sonneborni]|uniref:Uncharacterized protein n=1 Tax=Paramecium sonneborni TaxID=65129 RepID=A0A8S1QZ84_9CILI|nr:unnamed protein product [Paramecium sonneborni]
MYLFFKFYLNLLNHHFQLTVKSLNESHQCVNQCPNKNFQQPELSQKQFQEFLNNQNLNSLNL